MFLSSVVYLSVSYFILYFFFFFFLMIPPPPRSTLFPYTTLFRPAPNPIACGPRSPRRCPTSGRRRRCRSRTPRTARPRRSRRRAAGGRRRSAPHPPRRAGGRRADRAPARTRAPRGPDRRACRRRTAPASRLFLFLGLGREYNRPARRRLPRRRT